MSWYLPFSKRVDVLSGRWKQLLCTRPDVVLTFKSHVPAPRGGRGGEKEDEVVSQIFP